MEMIRTSLRLTKSNKINAERKARENGTTLQDVFNQALEKYIFDQDKKTAKKIVLTSYKIDKRIDNLTRNDIYGNSQS